MRMRKIGVDHNTGGGSWYISIEEYSQQWMFQGMGKRGSTGG